MPLPPGPYNLILLGDQLLTAQEGNNVVGSPLNILPPTGNPGEQTWHVENGPDNSITLRNLQVPVFVGVGGEPEPGSRVVIVREPFLFRVEDTDDPERKYIYVERGSEQLYVNVSPIRIFPPQLALSGRREEPWKFQFLE